MTKPRPLSEVEVDELRRIADRVKRTEDKRTNRRRQAEEQAKVAILPNPNGVQVPPMPDGLDAVRSWVRHCQDLYSKRQIGSIELNEVRKSANCVADNYKVKAVISQSKSAARTARAQEKLAETLAHMEHGGVATMLFARLQSGLADGKRRPLPARVLMPEPSDEAPA